MGLAKQIVVKPISGKDANALVKRLHYSKAVMASSQLDFGVFLCNFPLEIWLWVLRSMLN